MREALFKTNESFVYVQDSWCGSVDYTIYNKNFFPIDGGIIEDGDLRDLKEIVSSLVGESNIVKEVSIEEYAHLLF